MGYKKLHYHGFFFFFSSRRRHTRLQGDWSSDVCSSDLTVKLVDIEFLSPDPLTGSVEGPVAVPLAVPLKDVPKLIPEFKPSLADDAPTYRSNLFIIMLQNETSKEALRLVKQRNKEDYAWSLSYRLYTAEPFPPRITLNENVNRVEIAVDSLQLIKDHHKLTHEAMINPFSSKAASLPPLAEPTRSEEH